MTSFYDFSATALDGDEQSMDEYRGKVLLIVNVASKCGFTPQYTGLETLYRKHRKAGFVVLGFPCDQFGHQEPGDEAQIQSFCELNYGASFPLFAKIEVNGADAHPLWKWLRKQKPGLLGISAIKWNFSKFLIDRDGNVVSRHAPVDTPESLESDVIALL